VQGGWALQQLASALLATGADADDLAKALAPYQLAYRDSFVAHTHALLGIAPAGEAEEDVGFLQAFYAWMTKAKRSGRRFFMTGSAGRQARPGLLPHRRRRFIPMRPSRQ
jgi:uncharacterized protein YdiU (UPF0061 family)